MRVDWDVDLVRDSERDIDGDRRDLREVFTWLRCHACEFQQSGVLLDEGISGYLSLLIFSILQQQGSGRKTGLTFR